MVQLKRVELDTVWNWMEPQITTKDREWLKENIPGFWTDPKDLSVNSTYDISFRIQDVLDAKKRTRRSYGFAKGLPKRCLIELAELLKLDVTEETLSWRILVRILKEIEERTS